MHRGIQDERHHVAVQHAGIGLHFQDLGRPFGRERLFVRAVRGRQRVENVPRRTSGSRSLMSAMPIWFSPRRSPRSSSSCEAAFDRANSVAERRAAERIARSCASPVLRSSRSRKRRLRLSAAALASGPFARTVTCAGTHSSPSSSANSAVRMSTAGRASAFTSAGGKSGRCRPRRAGREGPPGPRPRKKIR